MQRRSVLAWGCGIVVLPPPARAVQRIDAQLFGSPIELLLPPRAAPRTIAAVLEGLHAMHQRWNAWKPGSVRSINEALREGRVATAPPMLALMIRRAAAFEAASAGHFNAAIGALVGAWGFHADRLADGPAPDAALRARLQAVRPSLAQLDIRGNELRSRNPALQLDFGACGKGVALDWALDRLVHDGVHEALLNLGGNLAAMGCCGGRPWSVGIRDPHREGLAARIATDGREAVVTSGSYERWRIAGGRRATHIIDPASAAPAAGLASVTVVQRDAALADAAATALLVAGPSRWRGVAQRMGVAQVLVIDEHGRVDATPAMAPRLLRT